MKKYILSMLLAFILSGNALALDITTDKNGVITGHEMPVKLFERVILEIPERLNHPGMALELNAIPLISTEDTHYYSSEKDSSKEFRLITAAMKPHKYHLLISNGTKMPDLETLYGTYGYNKAVKNSIDYYSGKTKKSFSKHLSRAGRYIDIMVDIFAEKGLPVELTYLPLIESGFNTHAYSPKRASGPWQFMPATARNYGLKIDWWVDERRDPVKSTLAAAEYLFDLHERFDNWNLAMAAYNAGEGTIARAIKKVDKSSYWRIRKTKYIARETKNYVPSFIAAASIAIEPGSFGFNYIKHQEPLRYDTVEIDTPMDLAVVAKLTGVKTSVIKELNPELRRWCTPPNVSNYTAKIPAGTRNMFLAGLSNTKEKELFYVKFYKVKDGDTVSKIARRLGTQIQAIIDINSLGKKAFIVAGKTILVPLDSNQKISGKPGNFIPILKSRSL